ncbi:glycosyltransferase [Adlercreutzia muris]|uniref:glycosyltransferase n=1 Tax=Adlercreutzia muris TaxID=1796610 RepID=UPI00191C2CE6|nr:glycosyltransferase [Adlercreutzia muris]
MNISDTKPAGAIEPPASMEPGALAPSSPTGQAVPSAIESSEEACGELASPDAITATQTALARATEEGDPVILVVHASVGSGHRSAAYAIAEAIQNAGERARADAADPALPAGLDPALAARARVEVLDILDFGRIVFDGDATASMFTGWTRPFYDITWRYVLTGRLLWGGGTIWAHLMYPRFVEFVRAVRPAAIVATHITAANVAVSARMLTGQSFPILCVPTDYEAEGLWPHLHTDLFCVANEAMAETLRPRRVPEDRILITGIPASPAFSRDYDKTAARESFGLPADKIVVLALAGAKLPRPYVHFREALDELLPFMHRLPNMELVIVAGADEEYERRVRREVADFGLDNARVLGYVTRMAELMEAADVVICKPGGLTVTECLCARAPMILLGRAYGQEKANVRMLTAAGAAMAATTPRELLDTLRHISEHPASADAMLINASLLRRPHAADAIAAATFDLIAKEPPRDGKLRSRHFAHFYWGRKPAHTR